MLEANRKNENYELAKVLEHDVKAKRVILETIDGSTAQLEDKNLPSNYQMPEGCVVSLTRKGRDLLYHQCRPDLYWEMHRIVLSPNPFLLVQGNTGVRAVFRVVDF